MRPLPTSEEWLALASRLIWFEPPKQALADPVRLLAYAFNFARAEDMAILRTHLGDHTLREALGSAPPGIIDARSWAYWRLMLDLPPAPLSERRLPNG